MAARCFCVVQKQKEVADAMIEALATLCLVEVSSTHAPSYHCIPTPRDTLAALLHHADITLPKAFTLSGTRVSTKKKLPSERLVQ